MATQPLRRGDFGAMTVDHPPHFPREPGLVQRFFKKLAEKWAMRQAYRQTLAELRRLSDRELNDIGLSRWQIEFMARQSTHEQG